MSYTDDYFGEVEYIAEHLFYDKIEKLVERLITLKMARGRLFVLGLGGSAANASHAVNDFRKLCDIQAMTPTDNAAEMTARINDNGWDSWMADWLQTSSLGMQDAVLVLSVGGGNLEKNVSPCLVYAMRYAKKVGAEVFGIAGRDGGELAKIADLAIAIPTVNPKTITPHAEEFQSIILHLITSHPKL